MISRVKRYILILIAVIMICIAAMPKTVLAADAPYDKAASTQSQIPAGKVTQYGMVPIYGRDIKDGTYSIEVKSSSSMFRIVKAELMVSGEEMEATIALSGKGYEKLFLGTGKEAAASDMSGFIDYVEEDDLYHYTIKVESLNKALSCAAFSKRKELWYDRLILFDAASLPKDALKIDLPDYDAIDKAMKAGRISPSTDGSAEKTNQAIDQADEAVKPVKVDLEDGEYSIEVAIAGGSGKAGVSSPTLLKVRKGRAYAKLIWSSSNYDYMIVAGEKYLNLSEGEGNSTFEIPITVMDQEMSVIADTTAMGTPHEVEYTLTFYQESIGAKGQMPQEAAKRVVVIGLIIIVGGGVLNHYVQKKRRR